MSEPAALPERPAQPAGLRERKKRATRRALGVAAMRLAVERGLDNVLVEDIAAAADVSPRTFSNYFANKYEAICVLALDRSARIGEALRAQPADEGLWKAISSAVQAVYGSASTAPDPAFIAGIRLVTVSPALRGEYLKTLSIMQYSLARAIVERTGADPDEDMIFARALAGAVTAAVQAATERWLCADPPVALAPVIEAALGQLAQGMLAVLASPGSPDTPSPARASASGPAGSHPATDPQPGENGWPPPAPSG